MANLYLKHAGGNPLEYQKIHRPSDHWSGGDKAMLISSIALGALLVAAGTLGILSHLGHNVGPFNILSSKLGITPYTLGAFGGGALLLTTVIVASVKGYQDKRASDRIMDLLTNEENVLMIENLTTREMERTDGLTPLYMTELTAGANTSYTRGVFERYHVLYSQGNVWVFASKSSCDKKAESLVGQTEDSPPVPQYSGRKTSVMDQMLYKRVSEMGMVDRQEQIWNPQTRRYVYRTVKREEPVNVEKDDKTIQEKVPVDRVRLGFGITLSILSIAAIVIPIFLRFKMGNAVQMFGIGSGAVMFYGGAAGMLLAKRSDEFVQKGHDKHFRRISKKDSKYLNGLGYGISRAFFIAIAAGGLMALAGNTMHHLSINPLYVAPAIGVGAAALLAYTHFKGKERDRAWREGCTIEMEKPYDEGEITTPLGAAVTADTHKQSLHDARGFSGKRFITRERSTGRWDTEVVMINDLASIQNRTAFEGAKRQYNLSAYLLPMLALILIVALVGTRIFLLKLHKPI